jgi:hypothetical protein
MNNFISFLFIYAISWLHLTLSVLFIQCKIQFSSLYHYTVTISVLFLFAELIYSVSFQTTFFFLRKKEGGGCNGVKACSSIECLSSLNQYEPNCTHIVDLVLGGLQGQVSGQGCLSPVGTHSLARSVMHDVHTELLKLILLQVRAFPAFL